MPRKPLIVLLTCAAALLAAMVQAETLNVSLLISDSSPPYRQFADSLSRNLSGSHAEVSIFESTVIGNVPADLIVAAGMKAATQAAAGTGVPDGTPVLAVMVPEAGYRELLADASRQKTDLAMSAIYLDQPWNRRLDFLGATLPDSRRIGLLYSPGTSTDIEILRKNIAARGGVLIARPVHSADALFTALESVLASSDVLLAIPDSAIYSSVNIRNILLTSYRRNIPIVGISKAYVNAGALCAIFSTPEQLAAQAAKAVIAFSRNRQLPAPQYPADFTIEVNEQVARSLGIALPSHEAIRNQMDKAKMDATRIEQTGDTRR